MKVKFFFPLVILFSIGILYSNNDVVNSAMSSEKLNSETTSEEMLYSETMETETIDLETSDSGTRETEKVDSVVPDSDIVDSKSSSEVITGADNAADIESIANTLYLLAFNKDAGQQLWNLFGMDWSAPMSNDSKYLEDLNWFRETDKKKYQLENGNIAYYLSNADSNKTVILAHGYRGDALQMGPWARIYYDLGYNILAPDASGHGESGGETIDFGWLEKDNYLQWINLINEKNGKNHEILLHGVSMGAATVLMAAGEKLPSNVSGVIADSAYTSIMDEMTFLKGIVPIDLPGFTEENINAAIPILNSIVKNNLGFDMYEASVVNQVQKSEVPIALIHSVDDDFIPHGFEDIIFGNISSEQKYQWTARGGKHIGGVYYDRTAYKEIIETYITLFAKQGYSTEPIEIIFSFVDEEGNELAERLTYHGKQGEKMDLKIPEIRDYMLKEKINTSYTFGKQDEFIPVIFQRIDTPNNLESGLEDSSSEEKVNNISSEEEIENSFEEKFLSNDQKDGKINSVNKQFPKTGEAKNRLISVFGVICLIVVFFYLRRRKQNL
ncbi:TPA: alpha/beta fold hydrolase [Enterococcus faecium]